MMISVAAVLTLAAMGAENNSDVGLSPPFEQVLKIDVHAHIFDDMPEFVAMLRRINLHVVNICVYGNKPELLEPAEQRAEMIYRKYRPNFFFASTFDLTHRNEPGYAQQVVAWLDKSFEAGAVMTKIWKEVGMELRTSTGAYLMADDPLFDPIYDHLAKRGKPLMAHLADPIEAWLPLDPNNAHYGYFSKNPQWHVYGRAGFPTHEQIMAARDNMLAKHPDLIVIGAHLGSLEHDLDGLAQRLDRFPNFSVDVSARTYVLQRQPAEKVRQFFMKYQDRILYGTDSDAFTPGEEPSRGKRLAFTQKMEEAYRADFAYYAEKGRNSIGQNEIERLSLPREVLEKFYHKNAQRLMPALAE
jgi:predicted TIM-barrel fold metal-dependent hydrolase